MTWQCISPGVTVKCCTSSVVNETDDDMLWNVSEEDGMLGGGMKALTVKVETVTLIGKRMKNLAGFVY